MKKGSLDPKNFFLFPTVSNMFFSIFGFGITFMSQKSTLRQRFAKDYFIVEKKIFLLSFPTF
jgi:hypothetical protein